MGTKMKIKLAFQDVNIEYRELEEIQKALTCINHPIIPFGIIPFTITITGEAFNSPTIMFGGTKIIKLHLGGHLPKNSVVFYDALKFDQSYYANILDDSLLNCDAEFISWAKIKNSVFVESIFVKPASDLKYFAGRVLHADKNTVEHKLSDKAMIDCDIDDETIILCNRHIITNIGYEYRVFVVNNKIIDCTQYQINGKVVPASVSNTVRNKIVEFVTKVQLLYRPHDHYVIGVAQLNDGTLKVVEYNCLNCSGVYAADRAAIYYALTKITI